MSHLSLGITCYKKFKFNLLISYSQSISAYQKALLANGATSALRLHQRIPNFRLNMEFFNRLMVEDSAHYLFYSILFIFSRQITMVLLPIFLFALLHLLSFILRYLSETNRQGDLNFMHYDEGSISCKIVFKKTNVHFFSQVNPTVVSCDLSKCTRPTSFR